MSIKLRGGHTTKDRKLDRIPEFDERSRAFGIRAVTPEMPRSRTWFFGGAPWKSHQNLDQGQEGACVGFGWTQELITSPVAKRFSDQRTGNAYARSVYAAAKLVDEYPGEDYEGTSVLAGAKVMTAHGAIPEYRWAFSIDDLVLAVGHHGPAVVGTDWTEEMDNVRPSGVLSGTGGSVRGGHCYLIRGVFLRPVIRNESFREPVFLLTNSWGDGWGTKGDAYVKVSDFEKLLKAGGEACIPVKRSKGT